jgi:phage tail-like protein
MPEAAQSGTGQDGGAAAAQTGVWTDPYRAYNFKLEIQGVTEGHFTECTGLGVKVDVISYREGGNGQIIHRLPGQVSYADITLRYGLTNSRLLWDWFLTSVQGKVERRNISIVLVDSDGVTGVMRWNLINAWVSEWRGAQLNASIHEVAIETMTLVFENLERA